MFIPLTNDQFDPIVIVLSSEEAARLIQTLSPLFPTWTKEGEKVVYDLVSELTYATPRIALMCDPAA